MNKIIPIAVLSAVTMSHAAMAEGPTHIKVAQCSPLIRQELKTIVGHPLVIAFPQGESTWIAPMSGKTDPSGTKPIEPTIEGVKPEEIQKLPVHNLITLWPDAQGVTTMTVVAQTATGELKTYPFTITAINDDATALNDPSVTLNLICRGGPVAAPTATTSAGAGAALSAPIHVTPAATRQRLVSPAEKAEAAERLRTDAFNGTDEKPCHYHAKGKRPTAIEPMCPMDNGQWTLLRFKGLTRKPAVYIGQCEDDKDEERLARQHEEGDFVVVEEIAPLFCLRLGSNPNDVLEIFNDGYDPVGNSPATGTLSPTVRRDLIQAKSH